ncbi:MAG: hypothetical protein IIT58_12625 [Treponema sp.]|nr:hypothetical protein [Treponema sp.]
MKKNILVLVLLTLSFSLFAADFSKVEIGDSKASLIKQYGVPFKEIKDGKSEYTIWLDNKDIWIVLFENENVKVEPKLLDDLLSSFLELSNAFSSWNLGEAFSFSLDPTVDSSTDVGSIKDTSADASTVDESPEPSETESPDKIDKELLDSIDIKILECKIYKGYFDTSAGYRLKIKNNSDREITNLKIILYFYDKNGKVFYDQERWLIYPSSSWSLRDSTDPLKPNYSMLVPKSSSSYCVVEGIDLEEWDEGKMTYEIIELN